MTILYTYTNTSKDRSLKYAYERRFKKQCQKDKELKLYTKQINKTL